MMGRLCFLIALCSTIEFYESVVLQPFMRFFFMDCASSLKLLLTKVNDFGCGFIVLGCFPKFFNVLVLFFMFLLGFKFLLFSGGCCKFRGKSSEKERERMSLSLRCSNDDEFDGIKRLSFKHGTTKMSRVSGKGSGDQNFEEINEVVKSNYGFHASDVNNGEEEEEWKEGCREDQVFDVMTLRKMVKVQKKRVNAAHSELEKERMAAASAVDEAMAMILRLQNEKSALQIQANQMQRVAEEKQLHDQEVIQSLQWIIMKHESERNILEDQLRMCREKLKLFLKGEEWDRFDSVCPTPSASYSSFWNRDDDSLIGSLDLESSPM